jgi:hypothetical protein
LFSHSESDNAYSNKSCCCHFGRLQSYCFRLRVAFDGTRSAAEQGCQMVSFRTKNPNLGKFWRALYGKYWYILGPFGILYRYLGSFMTTWYFWCSFGMYIFPVWYHVPRKIWQTCCRCRNFWLKPLSDGRDQTDYLGSML